MKRVFFIPFVLFALCVGLNSNAQEEKNKTASENIDYEIKIKANIRLFTVDVRIDNEKAAVAYDNQAAKELSDSLMERIISIVDVVFVRKEVPVILQKTPVESLLKAHYHTLQIDVGEADETIAYYEGEIGKDIPQLLESLGYGYVVEGVQTMLKDEVVTYSKEFWALYELLEDLTREYEENREEYCKGKTLPEDTEAKQIKKETYRELAPDEIRCVISPGFASVTKFIIDKKEGLIVGDYPPKQLPEEVRDSMLHLMDLLFIRKEVPVEVSRTSRIPDALIDNFMLSFEVTKGDSVIVDEGMFFGETQTYHTVKYSEELLALTDLIYIYKAVYDWENSCDSILDDRHKDFIFAFTSERMTGSDSLRSLRVPESPIYTEPSSEMEDYIDLFIYISRHKNMEYNETVAQSLYEMFTLYPSKSEEFEKYFNYFNQHLRRYLLGDFTELIFSEFKRHNKDKNNEELEREFCLKFPCLCPDGLGQLRFMLEGKKY